MCVYIFTVIKHILYVHLRRIRRTNTEHRSRQTCVRAELFNPAVDGSMVSRLCASSHLCTAGLQGWRGWGSGSLCVMTSGNALLYKSTQQRRGYRAASRSNPPAAGLETPGGSTNYTSYAATRSGVRAFPVPIPAQDPLH